MLCSAKNLPGWERTARVIAGITMMACGFLLHGLAGTPLGYVVAAGGAGALLTGFVGFCPACAMVGRKLPAVHG
jgi:hypothetical protein